MQIQKKNFSHCLLFLVLVPSIFPVLAVAQDGNERILECHKIVDSDKRLKCYDVLAEQIKKRRTQDYIKPNTQFLQSQLRVNPDKTDFDLTVTGFVKLLNQAETDEKQKITIQGWTKEKEAFVLHIILRQPIELVFYHNQHNDENYSLLAPIMINGRETDPSLFIFNIAAMVP